METTMSFERSSGNMQKMTSLGKLFCGMPGSRVTYLICRLNYENEPFTPPPPLYNRKQQGNGNLLFLEPIRKPNLIPRRENTERNRRLLRSSVGAAPYGYASAGKNLIFSFFSVESE